MTTYTFRKEEKLCSQKIIGEIFLSGASFLCYPLKVVWKFEEIPVSYPAQVVFSIPKRLFKKAHDRNLLKRQLREIYRMRKHELYFHLESQNKKIAMMFVYIAKEQLEFSQIEAAMSKIIIRLKKITENPQ